MAKHFRALVTSEAAGGGFVREVQNRTVDELPAGAVLIRVCYSSLNYKDALSATGNRGVTRHYPHTPGIDAAGIVVESASAEFHPGDEVICTGYDLGVNTPGGFGQYIRVPADWVVPRPAALSLRDSMIYGTAGFTAAMSVHRLRAHDLTPDQGEVLVTGATGGVGSTAVAILAHLGYRVIAATGKTEQKEFVQQLGAAGILGRDQVDDPSNKALLAGRWAGAIDTVGGNILNTTLRSLKLHAAATCCGNVASPDLRTSVFPFILRGVTLIGIDSVNTAMPLRRMIWSKLAGEWKPPMLDRLAAERSLDQLNPEIDRILSGGQVGRVVVNLS
jgi:acrylyl-CoA reductase (NADPH)